MSFDPSKFFRSNIVDTCSVWNVLSSPTLYMASQAAKCIFSCTGFVIYECLHKPRKKPNKKEIKLQQLFIQERKQGCFKGYSISITDLQEIEVLENRKKLSKGELSSMVFAKNTNQGFLTDDQGARNLSLYILPADRIQTTPRLFGHLLHDGYLGDSDKEKVIEEHTVMERQLAEFFEKFYLTTLEFKLMKNHLVSR